MRRLGSMQKGGLAPKGACPRLLSAALAIIGAVTVHAVILMRAVWQTNPSVLFVFVK